MFEPIGIDAIQDPEVAQLAVDARAFLTTLPTFAGVGTGRLAFAIPGVLGVFHFDTASPQPDSMGGVWVVVGDLPSAQICLPSSESWQAVLAAYVVRMRECVDAVRAGTPIDESVLAGVPAGDARVSGLERRIEFLQKELVDARPETLESAC